MYPANSEKSFIPNTNVGMEKFIRMNALGRFGNSIGLAAVS
jgi:hypothetical protein